MGPLRRLDLVWLVPLSLMAVPFKAFIVAPAVEIITEIGAIFVVSTRVWQENR
jgi:hypothetical protein